MNFIDNNVGNRVQVRIAFHPPKKNTGSAEREPGGRADLVLQPNLVAHSLSNVLQSLIRHPLRHANSGNPPRLRADHVEILLYTATSAEIVDPVVQDKLRNLRGFTTTGFSTDDDDLIRPDLLHNGVLKFERRKRLALFQHRLVFGVLLFSSKARLDKIIIYL